MTNRIKQDWMYLSQKEINENLSEDSWEHYKSGGCLCYAYNSGECCCGSWDTDIDELDTSDII